MPETEARLTDDAAQAPRAQMSPNGRASRRAAAARNAMVEDDDRGIETHDAEDATVLSFEDEDRALSLFLDSMQDSVLPDLPNIPGQHTCWLTTQNPRDPIARRLNAGYKLITVKEFPHLDGASIKTGEYAGVVGINEMVAAKIPERAYQRAMLELHHNRPNYEEQKIRARVDSVRENAARDGAPVVEVGDGTADLGKGTPPGRFS